MGQSIENNRSHPAPRSLAVMEGRCPRGHMDLTPSIRLDMDLAAVCTIHDGRADLDSWRFSARPGLRNAIDAAIGVSKHLDLEAI